MEFYEVLDQIIDLLKERGRASYRALKVQFKLDDESLEALKEELFYVHPVIDDAGRGLIWTGESDGTPGSVSQPAQITQSDSRESQPTSVASPPTEPHTPDAERRQLTVMFCDLVDSTKLSSQLDPEDYREVVRDYQQVCSEIIQRYDGHIAQLLGDGLLVYFGYPQAHEDDAQRAVRSGLGIIETIGALNARLEQDKGVNLAIRLGIHTGLVVVGEMGGEGRQEQLALGEVPNIASRLEGLAVPNTVALSAATYRLIQGYFECESMGEQILRGLADPIAVYRVLSESGAQSRLDIASARGLTPIVGREQEIGLLLDRWEQSREGNGQVVLLSGEAGIGKSRLVQVLKDHVADGPHTRLECRSSPYFTNSALYPITDFLQRTMRFQTDGTPEQKLEKLEQNLSQYRLPLEESVPLFGALLSLPVPEDRYSPLNLSPQRQRQKTLETIVTVILELAEQQPVLFILEDLHWTDPSTLEFIELLVDQTPTASVYALLTCRPEFQPTWSHRSYLTEMTVNRLSQSQVEQLATQVSGGKTLPGAVIEQLVERTDGVPLYVEEMTKAVLESGVLEETNGHYELVGSVASLAIPATLQDSLMARLDRLVTAKAVAQYGSVIGRQFSYELLQAVSELDEATLQRELSRLVEAELIYQRGVIPQATYIFKHALIQDIAYESLLRTTRQGYHRRIAEVLEERFPEMAENQPELLAHHFTEAGLNERAVDCWYKAGEKAIQGSANAEAIIHLRRGLELIETLPETLARHEQEFNLCITLGAPLLASQSWASPQLEETYARAHVLCERIGQAQQSFSALFGLWAFYEVRGELQTALELAEQCLSVAQQSNDSSLLLQAHFGLGNNLFYLGEIATAYEHHEQAIYLYDAKTHHFLAFQYGQDVGVVSQGYTSWDLWLLGYPSQAIQRGKEALTLATELGHPFSLCYVQCILVRLYSYLRERQDAQVQATVLATLATEHGFTGVNALGMCIHGWAQSKQASGEEGATLIQRGMDGWQATGALINRPFHLTLLAEAYRESEQVEDGLNVLLEAIALVEDTGERYWEAEIYRLKGELLLQQSKDNQTEAESCYQNALEVSRHQQAKSLELRAATSLARLWQRQGKREEARELLEPVYSWFTEGFDTADLIDAKMLLDELA